MTNALDAEDFDLLLLALDVLDQYTSDELSKARKAANNAKQAALLNMRARLIVVRAKIRTMQVSQ